MFKLGLAMPGLVPGIHVFLVSMYEESKTWMPATSAGMTELRSPDERSEIRGRPSQPVPHIAALMRATC